MATINSLGPELLEPIFDYVLGDEDKFKYLKLSSTSEIFDTRSSKKSLLLVNKAFYATAQRLHNRHLNFIIRSERGDSDTTKTVQQITELLHDSSKEDLLKSIRALTITCEERKRHRWVENPQPLEHSTYRHNIDQLPQVVAKIPKLRTLTFVAEFPISTSLLQALEKHHPQCHLHIRDWQCLLAAMDLNDPTEMALAHSPNLRSIKAELFGDGGPDLRISALKRIVLLSPHLESVDINEGRQFGCFVCSYSSRDRAEIEQLGNQFTTSLPSPNNIKSLRSRGGDHVKILEDMTDMRKLESLNLICSRNFDFFASRSRCANFQSSRPPRFESLKHLSMDMSHWHDPASSLRDFLAVCSPLETLKITNRRGRVDLSIILDNHRHSLRKLHLHESEREVQGEHVDCFCLSLDEIREVRRQCPELKEFTADMELDEHPASTRETLTELAQFENLEKLILYFPLDLVELASSPRLPKDPLLLEFREPVPSDFVAADPFNRKQSPSWLENIYSFLLYQREINGLPPLKELRINLGEWERESPMGLLLVSQCVEEHYKRCFILTPSERNDDSDKVELRTLRLECIYDENIIKEEREVRQCINRKTL